MANKYNFSSDKINIHLVLVDQSGSMESHRGKVIKGLERFKKSFENFPEVNSITVSVSYFTEEVTLNEFRHISEINTYYNPDGWTALNYAIVEAKKYLDKYVKEVVEKTECTPIVTFTLMSDGLPEHDRCSEEMGKETIKEMNIAGYNTVFVAFGRAINSEFGKKMGFVATRDIEDKNDIEDFFARELSKSVQEQSKRETPMGAEFLSNAKGGSNQNILGESFFSRAENQGGEFSHTTSQALEDDSWFDDI